jgi:hypothetical protein
MNILNLARRGKRSLLEAACQDILEHRLACTYSAVKNTMEAIKSKKMSGYMASCATTQTDMLGAAGCVRGANYYSSIGGDAL